MPNIPGERLDVGGPRRLPVGPVVLVLTGAMLLVLWARLPDLLLDHDETEHLHSAWLVSQGDVPYRDFAENHNPPLWSLLAPLLPESQSPRDAVLAGRAVMAGCSLLSLVLAGLLARRIAGRRAMWLAPLLLAVCTYWSVYSVQIRPDVPMTTLVLLGLLVGLPTGNAPSPLRSLVAGLAFGVATAILLKAAAVSATLFAGLLVRAVLHRDDRRRSLLAAFGLAVGAAIPMATFAAVLHGMGILDGFWLWVVRLQGPLQLNSDLPGFPITQTIGASIERDTLCWAGLALSVVRFSAAPRQDRAILLAVVAVVLGGTAGLRLPHYQYLFPAIPLFAVLGADAVVWAGERLRSMPRVRVVAAALLITALGASAVLHSISVASLPDDESQIARMERILALTRPDDTVVASPPDHPIFRRDALFLWFNNPDFHNALASLDPLPPYDRYKGDPQRLREHPPTVIVKAGSHWHSFYGIGTLAGRLFVTSADPEVLVRVH